MYIRERCMLLIYLKRQVLIMLFDLKFQLLEVVSLYHEPQLQVSEKSSYVFNFRPNISRFWCLNTHLFPITLIQPSIKHIKTIIVGISNARVKVSPIGQAINCIIVVIISPYIDQAINWSPEQHLKYLFQNILRKYVLSFSKKNMEYSEKGCKIDIIAFRESLSHDIEMRNKPSNVI